MGRCITVWRKWSRSCSRRVDDAKLVGASLFEFFGGKLFAGRAAQVAASLVVAAFGLRFPRGKLGSGRKRMWIAEWPKAARGTRGSRRESYNPNSRAEGLLRVL